MGRPLAARISTPAARTGAYYTTLLLSAAVANPFLPIWLTGKGMTTAEIGMINALPILLMVALNLVVGRIADRASDWRTVIVVGSIAAAVPPFMLLVAEGYWAILIVWALLMMPFQAIAPVVDAAAFRMARRQGIDFGILRVWGTIGFVAMTLVAGFTLDIWGVVAFVPLMIAVSLVRAAMALQLPLMRDRSETGRPTYPIDAPVSRLVAVRAGELWQPWFILTLLGAALLFASQMMFLGFGALIWSQAGISGLVIGLIWAVAPASEIVAMLYFHKFSKWLAARQLILIGCGCAVLRWCGFALEPDVWVLAVLQLLNMATVGFTILGITSFIGNWTSEHIAAEAQSFFFMIRQVITVAALIGFGYLVGTLGAGAYFVAAGMAALGGALILASLVLMNPRRERAEMKGIFR